MDRPRGTRDPDQHALAIAEAVDAAWNTANTSGRRDVVLSVIAGLSLIEPRHPDGPDPSAALRAQSPQEFTATLRHAYRTLINFRPDLIHLVHPLMAWLFNDPNPALQHAAKHVAETAVDHGQFSLTGTTDRHETDLLGMVLTMLKSTTASRANAQVYTPTSIAALLTRMSPPQQGQVLHEPAVGTGGLFRAAAEAMRKHGRDPATVVWCGADIDDLAIAACAINTILWGLGPRILLCVANTLTEPNWAARAATQRDEITELAATVRRDTSLLRAVRQVMEPGDANDAGPAVSSP